MNLTGRIESTNAAEWYDKIRAEIPETGDMELDCSDLVYISSAGIRIIINIYKIVRKNGYTLILRNIRPPVMEVLELTGVSDFITIM